MIRAYHGEMNDGDIRKKRMSGKVETSDEQCN